MGIKTLYQCDLCGFSVECPNNEKPNRRARRNLNLPKHHIPPKHRIAPKRARKQ